MIICIRCGYIYERKAQFRSLTSTWCCPDCGGNIKSFAELDESLPEKTKLANDSSFECLDSGTSSRPL